MIATDRPNLAVIVFDSVQLLVPQGGITSIEMIEAMQPVARHEAAVGSLRVGDREWPVFALDASLRRLPECADSNKYCVAFALEGQPAFALACDEVGSLALDSSDQIQLLPNCMRYPDNPLEAMLLKDDRLMLVSQIGSMRRFLGVEAAA